jgi:hypothetical protein
VADAAVAEHDVAGPLLLSGAAAHPAVPSGVTLPGWAGWLAGPTGVVGAWAEVHAGGVVARLLGADHRLGMMARPARSTLGAASR